VLREKLRELGMDRDEAGLANCPMFRRLSAVRKSAIGPP